MSRSRTPREPSTDPVPSTLPRDVGFGPSDSDSGEVTVNTHVYNLVREPVRQETVAVLRVVAGRDLLQYIRLDPGTELVIGRDDECELRLSDASVSRRHARIHVAKDGTVAVQDLGSTNGTAINGRQVERGFLQVGGHLEVGAVGMRLESVTGKELAHLERVLGALSSVNRDQLTGLMTRAWLEEDLPALLARADAADTPVAAILLDVDHFKSINDRFGHNVGDDVLRGVARIVLYNNRDQDAAIRYGGEEILLVLSGANEKGAWQAADRIRRDIRSHDWARTAIGLGVTASAGVAQRARGEAVRDWIERTDRALYAAKNGGRNQVVAAAPPPGS